MVLNSSSSTSHIENCSTFHEKSFKFLKCVLELELHPVESAQEISEEEEEEKLVNKMVKRGSACCDEMGKKKGPWTPVEDRILASYIHKHGHQNWRALPRQAGLMRCGKSCRLRWMNYLRPDVKRGNFSAEEREVIVKLHAILGNRWSAIAARLPGRTDNEIKNLWHTHLKKKLPEQQAQQLSTTLLPANPNISQYSMQDIHPHQPQNYNPPALASGDNNSSERSLQRSPESSSMTLVSAPSDCPRTSCGSSCDVVKEDMEFWYNLYLKAAGDNAPKIAQ